MRESIEEIREHFKNDRFAHGQGIEIESAAPGRAVCSVALHEGHNNAVGRVQGGLIFTLADFAFAVAANARQSTTLNLTSTIQFLRPPKGAVLRAEACAKNEGKNVSLYTVSVTDAEGRLVAEMSVTGFKPEAMEPRP